MNRPLDGANKLPIYIRPINFFDIKLSSSWDESSILRIFVILSFRMIPSTRTLSIPSVLDGFVHFMDVNNDALFMDLRTSHPLWVSHPFFWTS